MWYTEFTVAAALVVLTGLGASATTRRTRRPPHPRNPPGHALPLLDAAFLAGGPARVADTVIVRMHQEGRLIVSREQVVTVTDGRPRDEIESVLIGTAGAARQGTLPELRRRLMRSEHVQRIGDRLAEQGLMCRPGLLRGAVRARLLLRLALLASVVLGVVAGVSWIGLPSSERDTSVPPFFAFLGLVLLGAVWLTATKPARARITPAGFRQLALLRSGPTPWQPTGGVVAGSALVLGAMALEGAQALDDEYLRATLLAQARSSLGEFSAIDPVNAGCSSGTAVTWCAEPSPPDTSSGSSGSSCGSSAGGCGSAAGGGSAGSSCGSSGSSCASSGGGGCGSSGSSSSCGGSTSSCGSSSSSCGGSSSSCGGGSSCGS